MGRRKETPSAVRSQIVALREKGRTIRAISDILGVSKSTVDYTCKRFNETHSVEDRKRSGRPPKLSRRDVRKLVMDSKRNRRSCSRELTAELNKKLLKKVVARSVRRILRKAGLRGYVARKKPFISAKNRLARLKFAREHINWTSDDWAKVLWTDEKKYNRTGNDGRIWVRRRPDEAFLPECMHGTVKYGGGGVMMWACFSHSGPGPMVRIHGILNAQAYITDILEAVVDPYSEKLPLTWIYQQDNAAIHTAKSVKDFFGHQNWRIMQWPAQSPDLNPIENLWTESNKYVKAKAPRTLDELEKVIIDSWNMISAKTCADLVESMPRRCRAVLRNKGYPTKY